MINDLFRTYKKIILLLLVLLCSVVFWFYGCRHQQRSQSEVVEWNKKTIKGTNGYCYKFKTSNCTGTVTFGAAGYVAKDKEMPVTLDIFAAEKEFYRGNESHSSGRKWQGNCLPVCSEM